MSNAAWLTCAIVAEVIATSFLKASDGFTKPLASAAVVIGYVASFYSLSLALRTFPVGVAYAIWSGVGIVMVSAIAWVAYGQKLQPLTIIGMGFIIAGVIMVNLWMPHRVQG